MDVDTAEARAGVVGLLRPAALRAGLRRIAQGLDRLDGLFAFGVDLAADHARDLVPDVIDIDGLVPVGGETAGLLRSAEQVGLI
jgi:hypothetical protein